jgi:hypothetical protein
MCLTVIALKLYFEIHILIKDKFMPIEEIGVHFINLRKVNVGQEVGSFLGLLHDALDRGCISWFEGARLCWFERHYEKLYYRYSI